MYAITRVSDMERDRAERNKQRGGHAFQCRSSGGPENMLHIELQCATPALFVSGMMLLPKVDKVR